jgi:hypothetical protein
MLCLNQAMLSHKINLSYINLLRLVFCSDLSFDRDLLHFILESALYFIQELPIISFDSLSAKNALMNTQKRDGKKEKEKL